MTIPAKFKEYIWLVNTIRKVRRISFAEIQEKWLDTDIRGSRDSNFAGSAHSAIQ